MFCKENFMKSVKIVPINDLIEVHTAFNFFKANFFRTVQTELIAFLPLSEIYQTMLDNMQEDNKLQFLALADELPVGCVICQKIEKTTLAMPVLAVRHEYRGMGIARKLLEEIEKHAKKKGFLRIKAKSTQTSIKFFAKHNFKPFLYVSLKDESSAEKFKADLGDEFALASGRSSKLKFLMPKSYDEAHLLKLQKKYGGCPIEIYYEKQL